MTEEVKRMMTPKYLTGELIELAVHHVINGLAQPDSVVGKMLKRHDCAVVVAVPTLPMLEQSGHPDWGAYPVAPAVYYQETFGDTGKWEISFDAIAQSKAHQLWTDRNDDRTDVMPHLLFTGDTIYWGGVKRYGIVVTCSGFQPYFDKMVAGMIADLVIALAYHAYMSDLGNRGGFVD